MKGMFGWFPSLTRKSSVGSMRQVTPPGESSDYYRSTSGRPRRGSKLGMRVEVDERYDGRPRTTVESLKSRTRTPPDPASTSRPEDAMQTSDNEPELPTVNGIITEINGEPTPKRNRDAPRTSSKRPFRSSQEDEISSLRARCLLLQNQLDEAQHRASSNHKVFSAKIAELERKCMAQSEESTTLRGLVTRLQQKNEEVERSAHADKKSLVSKIRELESNHVMMDKRLRQAHQEREEIHIYANKTNEELSVYKAELRRAEGQHELTRQLLQEKTTELRGAQAFLNQADSYAGADIIKQVEALNAEIHQAAAYMADTLFRDGAQERASDDSFSRSYRIVRPVLGSQMSRLLRDFKVKSADEYDPTVVQFALQMCMARTCWRICNSWALSSDRDRWIKSLYADILSSETPVIAGRWRVLTRAHSKEAKETNRWSSHLSDNVSAVLAVARCPSSELKDLLPKFGERLSMVASLAVRLQTAVGEGITSADFELYFPDQGSLFDGLVMEDTYAIEEDDEDEDVVKSLNIVGTTELGLRQSVDGMNWKTMLKAKVFFDSALAEV